MNLDFRTVVLGGVILFCVCTLLGGSLWRQTRSRFDGLGHSFVGFMLISTGLALMFLRGRICPFISVVVVNGLLVLGIIAGLVGLERFLEIRRSHRGDLAIWALFVSFIAYFAYVDPSTPKRIICFSVALVYFSWRYIKTSIMDVDSSTRKTTFGIGVAFTGFLILGLLRIGAAFFLYRDLHSLELPSGTLEVFLGYSQHALVVLWAYGLTLMVNSRLMAELDRERVKFSSIFDGAPHAIALTRRFDGMVIDFNREFSRLLELEEGRILGRNTVELGFWGSSEERSRIIDGIKSNGSIKAVDVRLRRPDGNDMIGSLFVDLVSVNGEGVLLSTIMDVTEQRKMELQIAKMAQTDPLTGLLNRAAFSDELDRAMEEASSKEEKLSLMFLDLDGFKPVNDDFGHAIGDVVLCQVTERMAKTVGSEGTLGRIGGDEFVVLLPFGEKRAGSVGEDIRLALERPFDVDGRSIEISCSVGIAVYPDHGKDEIELAKNADHAMYMVKKAGGNGVGVFGQTTFDGGWRRKGERDRWF
ncbi:MAG: sensor domain-containing diguanylate cyclase [Synergistota bacterium]|nr:sensor domain-containing diguanylate cyclase [Synergistota bacterium]